MLQCSWCGRHYEPGMGYNVGMGYCSRRCYEAAQQGEKQRELEEQRQENERYHQAQMRELEEQRLEEERRARREEERRNEEARKASAAREERRLKAEYQRRDAEQQRVAIEQQRLEDERKERENQKMIADIERDLSAYNIEDITGADNIYNKIIEMVQFFCKKNQNYTVPQIKMDYLKSVLYKFGADTKSLERFFAERDAVILSSVKDYLDNQNIQYAEIVESKKTDELIQNQKNGVRNYPLLVELPDYKKTLETEMKARFAPYQTDEYNKVRSDLEKKEWTKTFNHIALLSFLNTSEDYVNNQLNELCPSQVQTTRQRYFDVASNKVNTFKNSIKSFIDSYISENIDLKKIKSSENKSILMEEAGIFELVCNDGDGTKEEVEDVFITLLAEKLRWIELPSFEEMREWEAKRIAEHRAEFKEIEDKLIEREHRIAEKKRLEEQRFAEALRKVEEKRIAEEKRYAEEKRIAEEKWIAEEKQIVEERKYLRDKYHIGSEDFIVVESYNMPTFAICDHTVTQAEYKKIMGTNPSEYNGDDNPVENVTWYDVIEYCNTLSITEHLQPYYKIKKPLFDKKNQEKWKVTIQEKSNGYRLPTLAEWEFAAKGGKYSKGYKYSGSDDIAEVAWHEGNSGCKTHPIKQKKPDELGLYDMIGNVNEWIWDSENSNRKFCGGSWSDDSTNCEILKSRSGNPTDTSSCIGFRIVRSCL